MIMQSQEALRLLEETTKQKLFTIDFALLQKNLLQWAANGFPASLPVYEFALTPQAISTNQYRCSDGVSRNIWDWIVFVLGCDIQTYIEIIEKHLLGIKLTFSLQEQPSIVLRLHAIQP